MLYRYLLFDIRLILPVASPTHEKRSIERHIPLPAYCEFYSVHDVYHHRHIRGSVFDHRESSKSRKNHCSDVMAPNMRGVQLIFEFPEIRAERIYNGVGKHSAPVGSRKLCIVYSHRPHFTINIGEYTSYTIF